MNIFTLRRVALPLLLLLGAAQAHSQNWNLVWREDFGVAEDSVIKNFPDPSMSVPNHAFYEDQRKCAAGFEHWDAAANANVCDKFEIVPGTRGVCGTIDDGYYGITNSTWWAYNRPHTEGCAGDGNTSHFMAGRDHTGNKNGAMLVVNTGTGAGEVVYQQDVEFDLCDARKYRFVIYTASITNMGYTPVFPNLTMKVINSTTGKLIDVLETGDIKNWEYDETIGFKDPGGFGDAKAMREWQEFYIEFTAKAGDKLTLQVTNNCKGGTGNDFVLDDISLLRYDDENVPVPEISATSVAQAGAADACSYLAQFAVPQQVLADWKKIYDEVFFLWQQSTDEGISWQNVTSVSGVDKTEVEIELDKSKNTIFRVIITGGSTAALAEEQALYIAEHGGPKGGCAYYSISNTLSAKPAADCTFSADLMSVFDEDFGTVPGGSAVENPYVPLFTFAEKGLTAGNYAITANTKNTELNSWDGIPEFTDHTGNADGGMLYCRTNKDFGTIYERSIAGPFCKCKSYIFSFYAAALGDWSTLNLTGQVLDNKGNELASLPIKEGNNGKPGNWRHYQFEFSPSDAADALVVKIFSTDPLTEAYGTQVVIDDISLRVCGVHIPQDSICIDNTAGLTSLLDFD